MSDFRPIFFFFFQNVQLLPPPNFTGNPQQNFLHTFPRNQNTTQSLRTTQSGMPNENVIQCCNNTGQNQQRRKTVTFLEENNQDFPLPPPPIMTEDKNSPEYVESRV